jgi:quercetin dioxygenase-like cupin family protein
MKTFLALALAPLLILGPVALMAQPSAIQRTTLQSTDFPDPNWRSTLVRVQVGMGGVVARHTHPGVEIGYIEHGEAQVAVEGRAPMTLTDGQSFLVPPETPHRVTNTGPGPLTILSTYVVDRAKPIATPAPK